MRPTSLVHPRAAGLFSFGALLARLVARAPMVVTITFSLFGPDASQSAHLAMRGALSVPETTLLLSQSGDGGWVAATPAQPDLRLSSKELPLSIGERL